MQLPVLFESIQICSRDSYAQGGRACDVTNVPRNTEKNSTNSSESEAWKVMSVHLLANHRAGWL